MHSEVLEAWKSGTFQMHDLVQERGNLDIKLTPSKHVFCVIEEMWPVHITGLQSRAVFM